MSALPALTLALGPQTRLGLALNDIVRARGRAFEKAGLRSLPSRLATRLLRAAIRGAEPDAVLNDLLGGPTPGQPTFLSAVHLLGRPESAILNDELYPETERRLSGASALLSGFRPHIVIAVEPLTDLILHSGADRLQARVRTMRWERLYELSWADLLHSVAEMFPTSKITVVTPGAPVACPDKVLAAAFGDFAGLADPGAIQRPFLSPAGVAALDALNRYGSPDEDTLRALLAAHGTRPGDREVVAATGIDRVTADLLDQRFLEDIDRLASMPRVEVLR